MSNSWMKDYDEAVLRYEGAQDKAREMAKGLLAEGLPVDMVVRVSKLPESDVLAIKTNLERSL